MTKMYRPIGLPVAVVLAAAGLVSMPRPAAAINLACLLAISGSEVCGGGNQRQDEAVLPKAGYCAYTEPNYKGKRFCIDIFTSPRVWSKLVNNPPIRSMRPEPDVMIIGWNVALVQGVSPLTGARKILPPQQYPDLNAVAPGWSNFSLMTVVDSRAGLSKSVLPDGAVLTYPTMKDQPSSETELPFYTEQHKAVIDRAVPMRYLRRAYLAYPHSNPAATRGVPLPSDGAVVAFTETDLPGGCVQTVVGGRSFVLPARTNQFCQGAGSLVTPTMSCTMRTNGGPSTVGLAPLTGVGKLVGAPTVQLSAQPTTVPLSTVFASIKSAKNTAAWFYNHGPSDVQVECTP